MPKGVEHLDSPDRFTWTKTVRTSVMPKGVEHRLADWKVAKATL